MTAPVGKPLAAWLLLCVTQGVVAAPQSMYQNGPNPFGGVPQIPMVGGGPPSADQTPCPDVPIVQNFQADKYLGRWFEIERFAAPFQTGSCVTADYSLLPNCSIGVINSQTLPNGLLDSTTGTASSAGDPSRASLTVTFPPEEGRFQVPSSEGNYNVLATDYSNYAVVYSCSRRSFRGQDTKFEFSWVLARRPRVNSVFLDRLHDWLTKLGLDTSKYQLTRQTGCQYPSV